MVAVRFQLATDSLHEGPDIVRFVTVFAAPDGLQDLTVQEHLASVAGEIRQHFELTARERQVNSIQPRAARPKIHFQALISIGW
jgi:hypothetical protein